MGGRGGGWGEHAHYPALVWGGERAWQAESHLECTVSRRWGC